MTTTTRHRRSGYTLVEVLVVMAILIMIGGAVVPTLAGMNRDTQVQAGGDVVRSLADAARSHAMGSGQPHQLSLAPDGTQVRVSPAVADLEAVEATDEPLYTAVEALPKTVRVALSSAADAAATDDEGWQRVATFLPDGTCREDGAAVDVTEPGTYTLRLTIRGLTGAVTSAKLPASEGVVP